VKDQSWLKLLDLVCHKLGADDSRIEIGGRDPDDPKVVWAPIEEGRRLVALFATPPLDRAATEGRLLALLEGFRETLALPPEPARHATGSLASRELDEALIALATRTGAETIWIIDVHSPVLWGASDAHPKELDLDAMVQTARADQMLGDAKLSWAELLAISHPQAQEQLHAAGLSGVTLRTVGEQLAVLSALTEQGGLAAAGRRLRSARALVEIRERAARERELVRSELRGPSIQCFAHAIAVQYQLVLVFDETYSPLHAEGHVQRALPHIERLLLALPPVDPSAGGARGAKVIRLPRKG
jgi:hypothetical protein